MGGIFVFELLFVVLTWTIAPEAPRAIGAPIPPVTHIHNTEAIGLVLYTKYVYYFEAAGLILLVAMVGAIVLTLHHKVRVRRQVVAEQVARTKAASIELRRVRPGQGLRDTP